jgi:hypothetical protein
MNTKLIMIGAIGLFASSLSHSFATDGKSSALDWALETEPGLAVGMHVKGTEEKEVQLHSEAIRCIKADGSTQKQYLWTVHDPTTGYIWWLVTDRPFKTLSFDKLENIWLIPEVGLIRVLISFDVLRMDVSRAKAESYSEGRTKVIANLKLQAKGEKPSLARNDVQIRLGETIGSDFFFKKGDAAPPPPAKIVAVTFTSGTLRIELVSALTQERATIDLDADFKVVGATKNGQKVYPKP